MRVVNPDYARQSPVGSVFDVATWVKPTVFSIGFLTGLALGVLSAAVACLVLFPAVLGEPGPDWLRSLKSEIEAGRQGHPWMMLGVSLLSAALAYMFLSMCVADQILRFQGPFFLRVGPSGISLRVPAGLDMWRPWHGILELDLAWRDIADWRVVQYKEFGAISPSAGNLHGDLQLRLRDGRRYTISLAYFREPARIIWNKIRDAVEMVPLKFVPEGSNTHAPDQCAVERTPFRDRKTRITGLDNQRREIEAALRRVLQSGDAFVIFSDPLTEKFVQFCDAGGSLWLDLPQQTLSEDASKRAANYFQRVGLDVTRSDHATAGPAVATAAGGFEGDLGADVEQAAQVVLDIFQEAYGVGAGFEIEIDEQAAYYN